MPISKTNPALSNAPAIPAGIVASMITSDVTVESPYRITEAAEARDTEAGEIVEIDQ